MSKRYLNNALRTMIELHLTTVYFEVEDSITIVDDLEEINSVLCIEVIF